MLTILSLFDDRSRPKGSRDPLGIEAIWTFMGRKVVGNLTTVTSNLDNFIVALLCCHYGNDGSKELNAIQLDFMCAEQLFAYIRLSSANNSGFLGITRAKVNHQKREYPLGASANAQILSNQLSAGLWGLYSTAIQVAKLIVGAERKPTESGLTLIQNLLDRLGEQHWHDFIGIARKHQAFPEDIDRISPPFNDLLNDRTTRQEMVNSLLGWQSAAPLQLELYRHAQLYLSTYSTHEIKAQQFCIWILEQPATSNELKKIVHQIVALEPLLVFASVVMNWLQGQRNRPEIELIEKLQSSLNGVSFPDHWLEIPQLPHRDPFLSELRVAVNNSDARKVIEVLMVQNKRVMTQRGGAPWLEWESDCLKVRVTNDRASLPENLADYCQDWENNYFIESFLTITKAGLK
ncbi:MAG: hypothetical protein ACXVBX_11655 [Flavisolibacter sp.]